MFVLRELPNKEALLARFERQRRRNLVRIIAPIFAVLSFGSIFSGVPGSAAWVGIAIAAASLVLAALLVGAFVAAQRDRVNTGVTLTLVSVDAIIIGTEILQLQPYGLEVSTLFQYLAFGIAIVLAGLLADTWVIAITTGIMCAFSTGILLWYGTQSTPSPLTSGLGLTLHGNLALLVTINLVFLLAFAGLTYAFRRGFTIILNNLSDATQQFERAKQIDELKTLFIRNVNHELRNPVMALLGYMEGLRYAAPAEASPRFHRYLNETDQVVNHLRDLINAVLDVRQVENLEDTEVTLQPVDLREVLNIATRMVDPREAKGQSHELHITIPERTVVAADPLRLQQILTNLLSNAVKYSPNASMIEVEAQRVPTRGHNAPAMVEIRVRDHGLGIPPTEAHLLFNRFMRLPRDLASKVPGNGIGLYLCRTYATSMHGTLTLESTGVPGEGTTFILRLGAAAPVEAASVTQ